MVIRVANALWMRFRSIRSMVGVPLAGTLLHSSQKGKLSDTSGDSVGAIPLYS